MASDFYITNFTESVAAHGLSDKSLLSLSNTKADNTVNAYQSDWNDFCDWCKYNKQTSFPATSKTIVNYINDLAEYAKFATIRRRISAISENYNAAMTAGAVKDNPCRAWLVRETLIGLARTKGAEQKGKTPIYWDELKKMVRAMDLSTKSGLRDRALLLLGFFGAFRRSELVGLDVSDITHFPQGIVINIRDSKTDKTHEGQQIGIPPIADTEMDCITAIDAWTAAAGLTEGPLFRAVTQKGKVSEKRMWSGAVSDIVKKYAAAIGLDPANYGGHSLRHGFATYAALNGVEERLIMKQTRHRSVEMVRRYINEADLFTNNPISKMFGK